LDITTLRVHEKKVYSEHNMYAKRNTILVYKVITTPKYTNKVKTKIYTLKTGFISVTL